MGTRIQVGGVPVYRAEPTGPVRGGLVVIHEIWGLVDHITAVADRFAGEGYLVLAPDLLSDVGVTPEVGTEMLRLMASDDEAERTAAQPMMRDALAPVRAPEFAAVATPRLVSLVDALAEEDDVAGRIGVTGFCFGGSYSFALAAADDRIRAAVPFYGAPPDLADVGSIHCPVLACYGETDTRLMEGLPEVTAAMLAAGVDFEAKVYSGVGHAFFNDTNPRAYDADAADDAWSQTTAFLQRHLV